MGKSFMKELAIAEQVIISYLNNNFSNKSIAEVFLIKSDNEVLLQHLKAMKNIFEKAIKQCEEFVKEREDYHGKYE